MNYWDEDYEFERMLDVELTWLKEMQAYNSSIIQALESWDTIWAMNGLKDVREMLINRVHMYWQDLLDREAEWNRLKCWIQQATSFIINSKWI